MTATALLVLITMQDADRLIRDLGSEYYDERERATALLAAMPPHRAIPLLARALDGPDPEVRARAGWILRTAEQKIADMPVEQAAPILFGALAHSDPLVGASARRVKAAIETPKLLVPEGAGSPFGVVSLTIILEPPAVVPPARR